MKQTPLLFSAPMMRANLNTKPGVWPAEPIDPTKPYKSQSRRPIEFNPIHEGLNFGWSGLKSGHYCTGSPEHGWVLRARRGDGCWEDKTYREFCRYGQPGDLLWSRETWKTEELESGLDGVRYRADDAFIPIENTREAADAWGEAHHICGRTDKWKPSIFQPRWVSRQSYKLMEVRVERVRDISNEDAIAEGIERNCVSGDHPLCPACQPYGKCQSENEWVHYGRDLDDIPAESPRESFESLWRLIHGKRHPWETTWVWVLSYMVLPK